MIAPDRRVIHFAGRAYLATRLSASELDGVLIHEYAHLARRDDWVNLAGRLLQAAPLDSVGAVVPAVVAVVLAVVVVAAAGRPAVSIR